MILKFSDYGHGYGHTFKSYRNVKKCFENLGVLFILDN